MSISDNRPIRPDDDEKRILEEAAKIMEKYERSGYLALTVPEQAGKYYQAKLAFAEREHMIISGLDAQHRVIETDIICTGTINEATIHIREIMKFLLGINAAAAMIAHNHPSGTAQPSHADKQITARIVDVASKLNIRVLDHIIVGKNEHYSFASAGIMP